MTRATPHPWYCLLPLHQSMRSSSVHHNAGFPERRLRGGRGSSHRRRRSGARVDQDSACTSTTLSSSPYHCRLSLFLISFVLSFVFVLYHQSTRKSVFFHCLHHLFLTLSTNRVHPPSGVTTTLFSTTRASPSSSCISIQSNPAYLFIHPRHHTPAISIEVFIAARPHCT